ncbi:MAG: hypothetical protein M3O36_18725, partial [Myxococcota bacterium]|nr:hypothetical protein [Myxococcota bacterium]
MAASEGGEPCADRSLREHAAAAAAASRHARRVTTALREKGRPTAVKSVLRRQLGRLAAGYRADQLDEARVARHTR